MLTRQFGAKSHSTRYNSEVGVAASITITLPAAGTRGLVRQSTIIGIVGCALLTDVEPDGGTYVTPADVAVAVTGVEPTFPVIVVCC